MVKKIVLCFLNSCLACGFIIPGSLHENISMPMMPRANKKLGPMKSIFKRNAIVCRNDTEYVFQDFCCNRCKPGSVAKPKGCTKDNATTSCEKCMDGKTYMDNYNYHDKCLLCGHCDTEHGLEVEKNCTIQQNVKCRCRPGYFCSSSEPCRHCNPCDECKGGKILKSCNRTSNTRCDRTEIEQENSATPYIITVVVFVVVMGICFLVWYVCKKKKTAEYNVKENLSETEMRPIFYPDIDLRRHIPDIAEEMQQAEVKAFVRKQNVMSSRIEVIVHDNPNDGTEQKIKLLEYWYQQHGTKDAYKTLITTLRNLRFHATADRIKEKIDCAYAEENGNQTPS